ETTDAMQQRMYGKRNDEIIRDFFGDALSPEEVAARGAAKEELYRQMVGGDIERALVPGLRQFLERHRDLPMGLATNAEPANVDFLLDQARLRPYFRVVVNGHQVQLPKPHPEIYLRAAALLKTEPAHCIVFEDSESGVAAARAAGMRIVLLRTTHGDLPGTQFGIDNFLNRDLDRWLRAQQCVA
ncbi:MAG TPA: HAD-IA family hydrolase, partial [Bryobacteraceae bacterium]|nr:HAD-IA family hydrolase [Bryobacteraceae bacterium]